MVCSLFGYFITVITSFITEEKIIRNVFSKVFLFGGKMKNHILLIGWDNFIKYSYDEIRANGYTPLIIINDDD